jgi:tRNA(Ile2) C34 agmatinyltransferase TiaS
MIIIGLDDTDTLETRGTGQLARQIATVLSAEHDVLGVVRLQLLVDPRVPCTRNNSSAAILLDALSPSAGGLSPTGGGGPAADPGDVFARVQAMMQADFVPGSDPGLCVAAAVPQAIVAFGRRARNELVTQDEARALAAAHGIPLLGLGGDEMGVIGALAAVGLAASGEDGRYVQVGRLRELSGLQPVEAVLGAGIAAVRTPEGLPVVGGLVQTDRLRPARRGGQAIAVVEWDQDHWRPIKLD